MRALFMRIVVALLLALLASAQQPPKTEQNDQHKQSASPSDKSSLKSGSESNIFESKIKAEWEAIKNKDKKVYGDLLADDYQGVEVDGRGERNRLQAINELAEGNVANYTLWGFKVIPLGPETTFVIYEVTIQFPPKSVVRYSRVYISELWVKRAGQWKERHYQETHVK